MLLVVRVKGVKIYHSSHLLCCLLPLNFFNNVTPFYLKNKDLSVRSSPLAFAMVSGVKDVVTAVKFCAEHDIAVTVRGKGAHSPWGMAQVRMRGGLFMHSKGLFLF